eukprot:3781998-Pleurochrysis_carterae.AAC.1
MFYVVPAATIMETMFNMGLCAISGCRRARQTMLSWPLTVAISRAVGGWRSKVGVGVGHACVSPAAITRIYRPCDAAFMIVNKGTAIPFAS